MPDIFILEEFNMDPDSFEIEPGCEGESFVTSLAADVCLQTANSEGERASGKYENVVINGDVAELDYTVFNNGDCSEPINEDDTGRGFNITLGECRTTSIVTFEKDVEIAVVNILTPTTCSELADSSYPEVLASNPNARLGDFLSIPFDEERCIDVRLLRTFGFSTNLTFPSGVVLRSIKSTTSATLTGYSQEGCEGKEFGSVFNQCFNNEDGGLVYFGGQNMTDFAAGSGSNDDTILGFTPLVFGLIVGGAALALVISVLTVVKVCKPKKKSSGAVVVATKPL